MTAPESGEDMAVSAAARVGTTLNEKWTLERLLGVGGMGAVYEGRHRNGAKAAVKVLHMMLAREAHFRERFLREGYAANRVEHVGAVKVLDDDIVTSGTDEGTAYLVMELLTGESLQDRMDRETPLGEREFLLVASAVLDVLEAAHAHGVIHRDVKPENIFLLSEDKDGPPSGVVGAGSVLGGPRVKVLDFGLARLMDSVGNNTRAGVALGTPSFMSPEQASGNNENLDGRTDLFSLAAAGFRLIAGRRVHEGAQHVVVQVANMATLPAPKIKNVAPHVSLPFARVIDRALQFKREDRYPDAAAMRDDVQKALVELDEISRHPTLRVNIPTVPLPPAPASAPKTATIVLDDKDLNPYRETAVAESEMPTARRPPASSAKVPSAKPALPPSGSKVPIATVPSKAPALEKQEESEEPAEAKAAEDERHDSDLPPRQTDRPPKKRSYVLPLAVLVAGGIIGAAVLASRGSLRIDMMISNATDAQIEAPDAGAASNAIDATALVAIADAGIAEAHDGAVEDAAVDAGNAGDEDAGDEDEESDAGAALDAAIDGASDSTITVTPVTTQSPPHPKHPPLKPPQKPPKKPPKKPPRH